MFGPFSYEKCGRGLAGLRIAISDSSLSKGEVDAIVSCLEKLGLTVLQLTPEAHDKLIAETLFLTHLVGQTIHKARFERTAIDTVSFGYLMDAVESVAHDEALFRDVFTYNPYCKGVLKRFEHSRKAVQRSLTE